MASVTIHSKTGRCRIRFQRDGRACSFLLPTSDRRKAEVVASMVDRLLERMKTGFTDRVLTDWLCECPDDLYDRLASVDLVSPRNQMTVARLYEKFLESKPNSPDSTRIAWGQAYRSLTTFLGKETVRIDSITIDDAIAFKAWLPTQPVVERPKSSRKKTYSAPSVKGTTVYGRSGVKGTLSPSTAGRRVGFVKQWFQFAVSRGWLEKSPFAHLPAPVPVNVARQYFLSREDAAKILDACPDQQWRAIFVLSRFIGLRVPSELIPLKWEDVHFSDPNVPGDAGRGYIRIHDEKRAHCGQEMAIRRSPLWENVEQELLALKAVAKPEEEYLFPWITKKTNLRTTYVKVVEKAGVEIYPKLFHNLRASCETEYDRAGVKPTIYCRWLGNSPQIAVRHYVQFGEEDFQQGYSAVLDSQAAKASKTAPLQVETTGVLETNQVLADKGLTQEGETQQGSNCGVQKDSNEESQKESVQLDESNCTEPPKKTYHSGLIFDHMENLNEKEQEELLTKAIKLLNLPEHPTNFPLTRAINSAINLILTLEGKID